MVGAILAGGAGRRMGGSKAVRVLAGRPLAAHPAAALGAVCERVALIGKPGDELTELPGVELWDGEPPEPRHPATGIAYALERAGESVLVCACDMPFVTAGDCRRLVDAAAGGATAVVAVAGGTLQPVLGVYSGAAAGPLTEAAGRGARLVDAVDSLDPVRVELPAETVRSVDTPDELAAAERELAQPRRST